MLNGHSTGSFLVHWFALVCTGSPVCFMSVEHQPVRLDTALLGRTNALPDSESSRLGRFLKKAFIAVQSLSLDPFPVVGSRRIGYAHLEVPKLNRSGSHTDDRLAGWKG